MGRPLLGTFVIEPSQDHPGWVSYDIDNPALFNAQVIGPVIARRENENSARVRFFPKPHLSNLLGAIHGGALLSLIDISLFAGLRIVTGRDAAGAVTVDLSTQFISAGAIDQPIDAVVEVLRETRRLAFLRGVLEQDGELVAAFNGTVRKPSTAA